MRAALTQLFSAKFASRHCELQSYAGLDEDLACSATKTVAEKIQKAFSKNFRANKKAKRDEKESMARAAFKTACSAESYQQYATMGAVGKRKYGDFNAMMSKGGSMENLSMGPQVTEELVKACQTIVSEFGYTLVCAVSSQRDCKQGFLIWFG